MNRHEIAIRSMTVLAVLSSLFGSSSNETNLEEEEARAEIQNRLTVPSVPTTEIYGYSLREVQGDDKFVFFTNGSEYGDIEVILDLPERPDGYSEYQRFMDYIGVDPENPDSAKGTVLDVERDSQGTPTVFWENNPEGNVYVDDSWDDGVDSENASRKSTPSE